MKALLHYLQSIRHKMFHTQVRWTSKDAYTCMECFGREYKAGWAVVEEKKNAKRISINTEASPACK